MIKNAIAYRTDHHFFCHLILSCTLFRRRDLNETIELFKAFVQKIIAEHGKVQIMSHSMGGVVTLCAINELDCENIDSVFFVAPPFAAGAPALEYLTPGTRQSTPFLDASAFFTFPSMFITLPLATSDRVVDAIRKKEAPDEFLDFDFGSAKEYVKHGILGFETKEASAEDIGHLQHCLDSCKRVKQRMIFDTSKKYPKMALMYSKSQATLCRVYYNTETSKLEFPEAEFMPGDDTIFHEATEMPCGFRYIPFVSKLPHAHIVTDKQVFKVLAMLLTIASDDYRKMASGGEDLPKSGKKDKTSKKKKDGRQKKHHKKRIASNEESVKKRKDKTSERSSTSGELCNENTDKSPRKADSRSKKEDSDAENVQIQSDKSTDNSSESLVSDEKKEAKKSGKASPKNGKITHEESEEKGDDEKSEENESYSSVEESEESVN